MADLMSIGVSGLKAFQRALDVTSHNIANASTPGYSRQRVDLSTRQPERLGAYFVGSGVDINNVERVYDAMLTDQMRGATSTLSRLQAYAGKAESLNNLFADTSVGVSAALQRFMNSVQGVSNEPTSTAARQVMLSEANVLQQRLQTFDRRLGEINAEVNARVRSEVDAISSSAASLARLNEQIVSQTAQAGQASSDLLDARDQILTDLAGHLQVSVTKQDDGAWNVFVGNGQPLVVGSRAGSLVTTQDPFDPERLVVGYQAGSSTVDISTSLSGGSLGGLMDFRRELLEPVRSELGRVAAGLVDVVNGQHREGMDLYGDLGGDLFSIGGAAVLPSRGNTGGATLAATRADVPALTGADYVFAYDGSNLSARRADTGAAVTLTGAGTAGNPFAVDGVEVVVSGGAAAGDSFLVRPTANAIRGMGVQITDPSRIAAAAPIRASAGSANTGNGSISAGEVLDPANPALRTAVDIQFTDATHYTVNGAGNFTYTAGSPIDINGWRVAISGAPAAGDTFSVKNNAGGTGDNRNALGLADTLGRNVLSGGTESINGVVARMIGKIGVATNQARTGAEAQQVIVSEAQASIDNLSGVNLDEEAANMLRYQQAYQAAAQIIRITQDMFDALMQATRR